MVRGAISEKSKKGKKQRRQGYTKISYQTRLNLINAVLKDGMTNADACRKLNIKTTTGCLIVRTYRQDHRIFQKPGLGGPDLSGLLPIIPPPKPQEKIKNPTRNERYEARRTRSAESKPVNDKPIKETAQIVKREQESEKEIQVIAGVGEEENRAIFDPCWTTEEEMRNFVYWWCLATMPFWWYYAYD